MPSNGLCFLAPRFYSMLFRIVPFATKLEPIRAGKAGLTRNLYLLSSEAERSAAILQKR